MPVIIKNGRIVTANEDYSADIYIENDQVSQIGRGLNVPANTEIVDAGDCLVMPGGIDPHTHMQLPFMGTEAIDDFYSGTAAMLTGGTTMIIDFVIPGNGVPLLEAYQTWRGWAEKAVADYSFHVAITWWNEKFPDEMATLVKEHGVNSFKHFMAYKGAIMADDEILIKSFSTAKQLGAIVTIHAENGELVVELQRQMAELGITGPEGHPQSRPPEVEGEAANRAIHIAKMIGVPVYLVHNSCKDSLEAITRARLGGQLVYGEVLSQHLVIDDSVYYNKDWRFAAHHVMSPPFRPKEHQAALWQGLQSGMLQTTATDHCSFCTEQKALGKDDFRKIPNGTGGIEDRMSVIWEHGVNTGRLTVNEFVAVTSANTAKIFNIYPKKGTIAVGSDADIIVWDPKKKHTISAKTHHQKVDFNIYEGMEITGTNVATISQGKIRFLNGDLRVEKGAGRYIKRPPYTQYFQAMQKRYESRKPIKVNRS